MADVFTINGGIKIAAEGDPDADYIAMLRDALQRAEAGETTGGLLIEATHDARYHRNLVGFYLPIVMLGNIEVIREEILPPFRHTCGK